MLFSLYNFLIIFWHARDPWDDNDQKFSQILDVGSFAGFQLTLILFYITAFY